VERREEEALAVIELAGAVLADRSVWTRHGRAAQGYRHKRAREYPNGTIRAESWELVQTAPVGRDEADEEVRRHLVRPCHWTAMGALELASDEPDGPDVVRALRALQEAARGWHIARVEEELGHAWVLWTFAVALAKRPGIRLAPRQGRSEVDLTSLPRRTDPLPESAPATLRSSELRRRRRRAA
jgi:hypothetical protein